MLLPTRERVGVMTRELRHSSRSEPKVVVTGAGTVFCSQRGTSLDVGGPQRVFRAAGCGVHRTDALACGTPSGLNYAYGFRHGTQFNEDG
jgi:hypothetical protein